VSAFSNPGVKDGFTTARQLRTQLLEVLDPLHAHEGSDGNPPSSAPTGFGSGFDVICVFCEQHQTVFGLPAHIVEKHWQVRGLIFIHCCTDAAFQSNCPYCGQKKDRLLVSGGAQGAPDAKLLEAHLFEHVSARLHSRPRMA
jgi:hypothetical protein